MAGWLQPEDVAKLDVAVMCHKHRKELMDLLRSPECVLGYLEFMWEGTMEWIMHCQVKFTSISITNKFLSDGETVERVMQIIGPTLISLEYNCSVAKEDSDDEEESLDPAPISMDQIMYYFVRYVTHLESLRLLRGAVDGMVSVLLNSNRNTLKSFELSECDNVNASILKACCDSPCLEEVTIVFCQFTEEATRFSAKTNTTCRNLRFSGELFSNQIANFVCKFSHLRYVEVYVSGANLVTLSCCCTLVEHANVKLFDPLTLQQATSIALNWKQIVQLQILSGDADAHVCEQNVVLLFINKCPKLQQLALAPRLETAQFMPAVPFAAESRAARSKLLELTVSQLSKNALNTILKKCPELVYLCIHHPVPSYIAPDSAEFALALLNHTKVTHLYLVNCFNFMSEHVEPLCHLHKLVLHSMGEVEVVAIDASAVTRLAQRCPQLHTMHVHHCRNIHYEAVLSVLQVAPQLLDFEYFDSANKPAHLSAAEILLQHTMYMLYPRLRRFLMRS